MASNGSFTSCPAPFIAELSIGDTGGYIPGRWCTPQLIGDETVSCCFPCPFTDWQYSEGFHPGIVPWIALGVLVLMVISALTYILLPVEDTQRHYLTSSPLMGFIFMSVAFIIPLGDTDHHCHDVITPNDWLSETTCAFTGSLILYGVWVLIIGCLFRSLSLYLQLIWDVEPGKWFRFVSLFFIFGISLGLLGVALGVSGVSYQVGNMCYTSFPDSIGSFWGPLIGVAFVSWLIQMFIMIYCIRGVITRGGTARFSIFKKRAEESDPTSRAAQARNIRRNIWQILELQWRAIAISCLILIYVVYVAQAVLRWGDPQQYSDEELQPWIDCLIQAKGDKTACRDEADTIGPNQKEAVSALALLASCGVWGVICTARYTMVLGWVDWFHDRYDALSDLIHGRPRNNHVGRSITPGLGTEQRRPNTLDLELVPTNDTHSDAVTAVNSPSTLEEVDKLYGTRKYHVPKHSFSRPGTVHSMLSSTFTPAGSIYVGDSSVQNTITTTIESTNSPQHSPKDREFSKD
ncbi:hypothetical protein BDW74DRAFT_184444 [Aspergillus multicolor]|uniref:uncharacterized protein n=1 Tax=Aspergillus multicolor TaxID=41759 RepID=UPI003CCC9D1C